MPERLAWRRYRGALRRIPLHARLMAHLHALRLPLVLARLRPLTRKWSDAALLQWLSSSPYAQMPLWPPAPLYAEATGDIFAPQRARCVHIRPWRVGYMEDLWPIVHDRNGVVCDHAARFSMLLACCHCRLIGIVVWSRDVRAISSRIQYAISRDCRFHAVPYTIQICV